jgi:hypothetical protein
VIGNKIKSTKVLDRPLLLTSSYCIPLAPISRLSPKPDSLLIGSRKSSPAVDGATAEADYMCFSPLQRKTSELEREEYNEAKQSCGWNVPELRTT